jgi:hypothetical protein
VESPPVPSPTPLASPPPNRLERLVRLASRVRLEDWILAAWLAIAAPIAGRIDGSAGPFDPDRPITGVLCIVGVLGALICLVTGRSDAPPDAGPGAVEWASIGPLTGGLLLVALSGSAALGLAGAAGWAVVIAGLVIVVAVRLRWPALPTSVRRMLVTPFLLATGGIFWTIVDQVAGGSSLLGLATVETGGSVEPIGTLAFVAAALAAFSAVYYAMLIYAPRQVAEHEGGSLTWLVRYGIFLVSILVGVAWLRPFGV